MMIEVRGIFAEQMHATTALFSRRGTAELPQKLAAKAPDVHVDVHADLLTPE